LFQALGGGAQSLAFLAMTGEKLEMEEDGGFQTTKVGIYIYITVIYI